MIRRALLLLLLCLPAVARADYESWTTAEIRVPLSRPGGWAPTSLRLNPDLRIGGRYPGIGFLFLRVGPIWNVHPNLFIAAHATAVATQPKPGVFTSEYRLELEPNITGRLGPLVLNDRNRLEHRWIGGTPAWRYRNQLRVNFQPEGWTVFPFAREEALFDLSGPGFNQNRAELGAAWQFGAARLDVSYMLRSRLAGETWALDHVLFLQLFFAPPLETK